MIPLPDHLGVEIATVAHAGMLEAKKLLKSRSRLQSGVCLQEDLCIEGVYIDDYFAISREDAWLVGEPSFRARSSEAFYRAKEAYTSEEVFGGGFRVLGAEIDSRQFLVEGGLVSCGLPAEKRLALAMVASMFAWLPVTSDALHSSLIGSIISMLLFRRPAMSALQEVFHVIPSFELNIQEPKLWKLNRSAASELAVVAASAPVLASNLAAPTLPKIFAADASLQKGGTTEADISSDFGGMLVREEPMSPSIPEPGLF